MKRYSGFTLVELMIALAIVGIISAIALPAYWQYIEDGRQTEAKAILETIRVIEEQQFADAGEYLGGLYDTGAITLQTAMPSFQPGDPDTLHYDFEVLVSPSTGTAGDPNDQFNAFAYKRNTAKAEFFTINHLGEKLDHHGNPW